MDNERATSAIQNASEADRKLKKNLSLQDLFFISLSAVIGSGWLFAALAGASIAGPAIIFSWIIGAVLILFIGLNYAELAGMIPRSGAISRYPHISHGSFTGFLMGWAYLIGAAAGPAIEAEAVAAYTGTYIPSLVRVATTYEGSVTVLSLSGLGLALLLMILFFLLNYYGVKLLGRVNTIVSWPFKIVIPLITFVFLLFILHSTNFTIFPGGFIPYGVGSIFLAIPSAGIIFSYLGFRQALEYSGEAKNAKRDVPRALIFSVLVSLLIYTLLEIGFIGGINWSKIGIEPGNWAALYSSSLAVGPFYEIFKQSGIAALAAFGILLLADSWAAPTSSGWIYLGNATRTFYGLSANGYLAKLFLKINKRGIPVFSLIIGTIAGIIYLLPFPSWYLLVGLISATSLFTYTIGGVTLQVLRKYAPAVKRQFRVPLASVIAPLGFLSGVLVVYWAGFV
ncbi:MAG: APC family permease, partial [Thermoplasmatales archaeon]